MKVWTVYMVLCLLYGFLYCVAGGSNGCYDSSWTYHAHTHSCFKLYKLALRWGDALRKCQCHDRQWGLCQRSSLATIKDEQTNEFVKEFLTRTYQYAYIGLYKNSDNPQARWVSSNEVLTYNDYNDFGRATGSYGTFYTYIKQDGWYKTRSDYRLPFLCQTKAENEPMTIRCPKPVRVSLERTKLSFFCNFDFSRWDAVTWTDSSASEVATCGNDWKCTSSIGRIYSSSISSYDMSSSLTYEGEIHRDLEGPWKCSISDSYRPVDQLLDRRSCDLKVYEPAEDISCDTDVTSNGVMVTCTVEKIYPGAICFWKYKNNDEQSFTTAKPSEIISPESSEYPDMNTKYKYFTTQCQLNLTRETMTFSVGALIVKVRMAPNVGPVSVPREDRCFQEAKVNIVAPRKPVFKFTNDSVIDSDVVSYLAGEHVDIVCEIPDGFPMVYQTTMSCTFISMPNVSRGNRYILDMQATSEMNGKTCSCWGHHITTPTTSSTITFKILAASQVRSFISNPIEPKEGEKVTLSCQGHGVPEPEISISPNENAQITDKTSKNSLRVTFTAECQKRGPYKCTSENVINGQVYPDVKYLNLTVLCPPTTCGGNDHVPTFVTRLGKAHITLCAVGFPIPDKDKFSLHKDVAQDSDSKDVPGSFYDLKLITEGDILKGVDITFYDLKATDMGAYRLYSPETKKVAYSYLKFKLTSKGPPRCPDNFSVQEIRHNYVILTWTPGYSHTGKQTVELLSVSSPPFSNVLSSLGKVEVEGDKVITHRVNGLEPDTDYWISVNTTNEDGLTSCTDSAINVTTLTEPIGAQPRGAKSAQHTPIVIGIVFCLVFIAIIAGIIGFVLWRKKKTQGDLYKSRILRSATTTSELHTNVDSHGPTYSNLIGQSLQCDSSEAVVNGTMETPAESSAYDALPVRESNVYSNSSAVKDDENDISENTYYNCPKPEVHSPVQQKPSRKGKQKELVYVDVVIDPVSKRPEFKEMAPPSTTAEESVTYVYIDPVATRARLTESNNMPAEEQEED